MVQSTTAYRVCTHDIHIYVYGNTRGLGSRTHTRVIKMPFISLHCPLLFFLFFFFSTYFFFPLLLLFLLYFRLPSYVMSRVVRFVYYTKLDGNIYIYIYIISLLHVRVSHTLRARAHTHIRTTYASHMHANALFNIVCMLRTRSVPVCVASI